VAAVDVNRAKGEKEEEGKEQVGIGQMSKERRQVSKKL